MDAVEKKGYLLIAGTALFFGLNGIGIRWFFLNAQKIGPENVIFWGLAGAALLATPVEWLPSRSRNRLLRSVKQDGAVIGAVALLSSLGAFFWILALEKTGAAVVSLLAKSQVLSSVLLGALFLKERFTVFELTGFALSIPGILLISTLPDEVPPAAALLILTSAVIYSIQSLIVKRFAPGLHGKEFTYLRGTGMVLVFGIVFGTTGKLEIPTLSQFIYLGTISFLGLMIGRSMFFEAHKYLGIGKLNTGMLLEPVIVAFLAFFLLSEPLGTRKLLGAALVLLGLWMTTRRNLKESELPVFLKTIVRKKENQKPP